MPPVLPRGGRILQQTLGPGEVLTLGRGTLTVRPLGWEGQITRTVVFADGGKHEVSHTFTFGPHAYHPSKAYPWAGVLATGKLSIEIIPTETDAESVGGDARASRDDIRTVLRLLGDYERDHLKAVLLNGDSEGWQKKRQMWEARCAALTHGATAYLGYVATSWPDDAYRAAACDALDETKQDATCAVLVKCLADKSAKVRRTAARSLGRPRLEANVRHLVPLLLSDPDADVRAAAGYALGNIGSGQATEALVQAFQQDDAGHVKTAAALALGWIADVSALAALREALPQADGLRREYIEAAIRNIEDPDFWGLGVKGGVSEHDVYRLLLSTIDLESAPAAPEGKDLPDLFEERRPGSGSFRLRKKVSAVFETPSGIVYYIPDKNVFYVGQYRPEPEQDQYYGPFQGNPHEIARQARKSPHQEK
jgi:hypothetical protein